MIYDKYDLHLVLIFTVILRRIFEYHRVDLTTMYDQLQYSAIILTPLPSMSRITSITTYM